MSRRGIHPLLRGHSQPKRVTPLRGPVSTSGLESAQRKRYLRCLEAEQAEAIDTKHSWAEQIERGSTPSAVSGFFIGYPAGGDGPQTNPSDGGGGLLKDQ